MITPQEIETKEFTRALGGYAAKEVDQFLDRIILDMQELMASRDALEKENAQLRAEIEGHRDSEKSVMNTLDSAKKLMKDISESAEKRADIIIRNAKLDAEMMMKDAEGYISRYSGEATELKDRILYFRSRYKSLLEDELGRLEDRSGDLLSDLEKDFYMPASIMEELPDIPDATRGKASDPAENPAHEQDVSVKNGATAGSALHTDNRETKVLPQADLKVSSAPAETEAQDATRIVSFEDIDSALKEQAEKMEETGASPVKGSKIAPVATRPLKKEEAEDLRKRTDKKEL